MHQHVINASIQLLPIGLDKHPYLWVDDAIAIIQDSGLSHEVGPFSTSVEGTYPEVFGLIHQLNDFLCAAGCPEWILQLQIQIRNQDDIRAKEKTAKFRDA